MKTAQREVKLKPTEWFMSSDHPLAKHIRVTFKGREIKVMGIVIFGELK
jgi:hypothetical protein